MANWSLSFNPTSRNVLLKLTDAPMSFQFALPVDRFDSWLEWIQTERRKLTTEFGYTSPPPDDDSHGILLETPEDDGNGRRVQG